MRSEGEKDLEEDKGESRERAELKGWGQMETRSRAGKAMIWRSWGRALGEKS